MNFLSSLTSKVLLFFTNFIFQKTSGILNSYKEEFDSFVKCLHSDIKEVLGFNNILYF